MSTLVLHAYYLVKGVVLDLRTELSTAAFKTEAMLAGKFHGHNIIFDRSGTNLYLISIADWAEVILVTLSVGALDRDLALINLKLRR